MPPHADSGLPLLPCRSTPVVPDQRCRLICAGSTDKGMVRDYNEDRIGLFPELGLFVVADGMGGAAAGEVAAQMAVEHVCQAVADPDATWPVTMAAPGQTGLRRLVAGIERANHQIHTASLQRPELRGMGTTIAAVLACGNNRAVVAHVGDSRVYRLRGRVLDQLTEDHSWFNELIRLGALDPDQAEKFTHRNIITRAVGAAPAVEVDARVVEAVPGDAFLLCSDGLSGVVPSREITEILLGEARLEDAVEKLIARANHYGGPDNISAVAIRWEMPNAAPHARG